MESFRTKKLDMNPNGHPMGPWAHGAMEPMDPDGRDRRASGMGRAGGAGGHAGQAGGTGGTGGTGWRELMSCIAAAFIANQFWLGVIA